MLDRIAIFYYYLQALCAHTSPDPDDKIHKFLKNIVHKSQFYQELYRDCDLTNWRELPTINKSIMMENFNKLNTVNITKEQAFEVALKAERDREFSPTIGDITVGLSSGTSGNKGIFLVSPAERYKWAGNILAKVLPRFIFHKQKIAFFLRANSNLYTSISSKQIQFEFFDLLKPLDEHISRLNIYQPSILVASPSMLRLLAKALKNNKLNISPMKIISVAEVLDTLDKEYISEAFNQDIHQIYQATEGFLATTCEYGTLHLNEDLLAIQREYIDKQSNKFMPIITDFSRTTQPIIRYKLNDILTLKKESCSCDSKHTAIESIEGRSDDIFYLPAIHSDEPTPIFPDFISRAIIYASNDIEEYKITQQASDLVVVSLKSNTDMREAVNNSLVDLFKKQQVKTPTIKFEEYSSPPIENKLKRVESYYNSTWI